MTDEMWFRHVAEQIEIAEVVFDTCRGFNQNMQLTVREGRKRELRHMTLDPTLSDDKIFHLLSRARRAKNEIIEAIEFLEHSYYRG